MKTQYVVILLIIIFSACSKDKSVTETGPPPPPPSTPVSTKLLTLQIDDSYLTDTTDNWVMIHDVNGKLLEYKSFEKKDLVIIETRKDVPENKINISLFEFTAADSIHILSTYLFNPLGQTWKLKKQNPTNPPNSNGNRTGVFSVSVSGVDKGSAYQLINKNGLVGGSNWSGESLFLSGEIYENASDCFLYLITKSGIPKYKWLKNIKTNDQYNLSFNTLNDFDKTVTITFPQTPVNNIFYLVQAYETGQSTNEIGYLINSNITNVYFNDQNDLRTSIKLGFLNSFPVYRTTFTVRVNNVTYGYGKLGAAPDNISLPLSASFTLKDKSINNFSFEKNQSFISRTSQWVYPSLRPKIYWTVMGTDGVQKINELPSEFTTKYPELSFNKLIHSSTGFSTQGISYTDIIDINFKGKAQSENYEVYSVLVN